MYNYQIVYHSCVPLSDKVHVLQKNMLWERTVGINNNYFIVSFLCNQENYFYNISENKKILCGEKIKGEVYVCHYHCVLIKNIFPVYNFNY